MDAKAIADAIQASPILKNFNIDVAQLSMVVHSSGQIVRDEYAGQPAVGLIDKGHIEVYSVAVDGKEVQLNVLHPGDYFGISNLFSEEGLQTVLRCRTKVSMIYIPKKLLIEAMHSDAEAAMSYARYCNEKLQFLIRRIEFLTIQSSRSKLIEYLLSQADKQGRVCPDCSREDLAKRLGISRAALFRELSFLYRQKALRTEGVNFQVNDLQELEQLLYQENAFG